MRTVGTPTAAPSASMASTRQHRWSRPSCLVRHYVQLPVRNQTRVVDAGTSYCVLPDLVSYCVLPDLVRLTRITPGMSAGGAASMQGVTPSSNPLYDGVPLEPAPSVRQVGTVAPYQWQPADGLQLQTLPGTLHSQLASSSCCRASADCSSQMHCRSTRCLAAQTCR